MSWSHSIDSGALPHGFCMTGVFGLESTYSVQTTEFTRATVALSVSVSYRNGGCVDSSHQSLAMLLMVLGPEDVR